MHRLPYLGVFVYLIARGRKMGEHAQEAAQAQDAATREYIRNVTAADGHGTADDIARLADLRDQGVITEADFGRRRPKRFPDMKIAVVRPTIIEATRQLRGSCGDMTSMAAKRPCPGGRIDVDRLPEHSVCRSEG